MDLLHKTDSFRELEPGVGEIESDGIAELYYGIAESSDLLVAVRVASPTILQLIQDLAVELGMVVLFPSDGGWTAAVTGQAQAADVPEASWEGWERLGEPPKLIICRTQADLAAALAAAYGDWERWARPRG
jgi:hypothetical protein